MMPITVFTFLIYAIAWITIYIRKGSFDKKLMRCLTLIMALILCGYFLISLSLIYDTYRENVESEEVLLHHIYGGVAINATIAANYPIYYYFNQAYRAAFKEQLKIIFCRPMSSPKQSRISSIESKNWINVNIFHHIWFGHKHEFKKVYS